MSIRNVHEINLSKKYLKETTIEELEQEKRNRENGEAPEIKISYFEIPEVFDRKMRQRFLQYADIEDIEEELAQRLTE